VRRLLTPRQSQAIVLAALWALTAITLALLVLLVGFVLWRGLPALDAAFLGGSPRAGGEGGVWPMLVGTLLVTAIAALVATPLGLATAIYLTEYVREGRWRRAVRAGTELLASVPSILFGLFGYAFFVLYLGLGWSVLAGGLTLAAMILPTIVRTSEEALRRVPASWREVSLSLGGSRLQTVTRVVLPAALPGVATGVLLGVGRSSAETAAVLFTAGLSPEVPSSMSSPTRTLAVHLYLVARAGQPEAQTFGTAALLVLLILSVNAVAHGLLGRLARPAR
jgi:phosphate transport system permease protein